MKSKKTSDLIFNFKNPSKDYIHDSIKLISGDIKELSVGDEFYLTNTYIKLHPSFNKHLNQHLGKKVIVKSIQQRSPEMTVYQLICGNLTPWLYQKT